MGLGGSCQRLWDALFSRVKLPTKKPAEGEGREDVKKDEEKERSNGESTIIGPSASLNHLQNDHHASENEEKKKKEKEEAKEEKEKEKEKEREEEKEKRQQEDAEAVSSPSVAKEPPKPSKSMSRWLSDVNERTSNFIKRFYSQRKSERDESVSEPLPPPPPA